MTMKKRLILKRGESCEDCVFFDELGNGKECEKHQNRRCGNKFFFAYELIEGADDIEETVDIDDIEEGSGLGKCRNCTFYSCRKGYKPHCHYNGKEKSPVIDDKFKCPKGEKL